MKRFNAVNMAGCLVLASALVLPVVRADDWNRKTVIKFSGPVEIPGVHVKGWGVLPAGTYVFKIVDSQSNRHIVQIFSEDEKTVYATILAIPNYRLKATDKTVITFRERAAGEPEALRAWFYPGRNWGEEFVYPKAMAITLAKATNMPVLFTPAEIPLEVAEPMKANNEPVITELKRIPILAIKPTGEEVQLAEVVTNPPETELAKADPAPVAMAPEPQAAVPASPQATLPGTASILPLLGLLGFATLSSAFAVRAFAKRIR
jgi:hypothetical protein